MTESEIFAAAADVGPDRRGALLDQLCAGEADLRQRVETLLRAHDQAAGFLRGGEGEQGGTVVAPPPDDLVSARIGNYKLLQKLGEGGFGIVYMAEQLEPVRRKVAFKVIRPGMDSREVIARFESERQALALMEHPNIAQVFDAGTTSRGQPYFVMELVRGVPITEYCDRNRLPVEERLKLFISVCQAVQHAHHKGVIHRDIKPSNVMVTLHDGVPVVKVIDFGVAKATSQRLTEKTLFTQYGQMVGTPAYMSPEQAEMSGLDIDTRSDVYSLGVLLYELLTGSTPLEDRELRAAGWAGLQRLILEHEPPLPSLRVSSRGGAATVLANNRGVDLRHLTSHLRGDLDWIVMKSLEKDRNRRYVTPSSLAAEVDRYLQGEAIEARAPSLIDRVRRLGRKHRTLVLTALAIGACLVGATAISTVAALRATEAERIAERRQREAEESRAALQTSLEETQAARREAEALTSQVVQSQMTTSFDEPMLLNWLAQLPRLSGAAVETREYVKHCLLGAIQTMASLPSGTNTEGYEFAVPLRVMAFEKGLMAYTENGDDLTVAQIGTGRVVYQTRLPEPDWGPIAEVVLGPQCLVIMSRNGRVLGVDRMTWRVLYTIEVPNAVWSAPSGWFPETDPQTWLTNETHSLISGRYRTPTSEGFWILETTTGAVHQLPLPAGFCWDLSPAGDRLVVGLPNPNRLQVWNSTPPEQVDEIAVDHEGSLFSIGFLLDGTHVLAGFRNADDSGAGSAVWSLEANTMVLQKNQNVAPWDVSSSAGESFLRQGDNTLLLTRKPEGVTIRELSIAVARANAEWLVDDEGRLYSRETLQPVPPPAGRRYASQLREFAIAERYLHLGSAIIDLALELQVPGEYWNQFVHDPVSQHVLCGNPGYFQMVLPVRSDALAEEQLQALVELVVCAHRDDSGQLRPWSEDEWQTRLQQAETRGWLDATRFPHLVAFLKQPAYWWKHEVTRPRPGMPGPQAEAQTHQAWRDLYAHDVSLAGQLRCVERLRQIDHWSAPEFRAQHLRLVRQYGRDYWAARWNRPLSLEETADEALPESELAAMAEYYTLRREFLRLHQVSLSPEVPSPYDALADCLVLIRRGEDKTAIPEMDSFLEPWLKAAPPPEPDKENAPYLQGLLALRVVALARQQRWAECRTTIEQLNGRLPPLEISAPDQGPTETPRPQAQFPLSQRLAQSLIPPRGNWSAPGPPVLLWKLLDESLARFAAHEKEPSPSQTPPNP